MIKVFLNKSTDGFTQALVPISVFTELRTGGEQAALTGAQGTPSPMDVRAERGTRKTAGWVTARRGPFRSNSGISPERAVPRQSDLGRRSPERKRSQPESRSRSPRTKVPQGSERGPRPAVPPGLRGVAPPPGFCHFSPALEINFLSLCPAVVKSLVCVTAQPPWLGLHPLPALAAAVGGPWGVGLLWLTPTFSPSLGPSLWAELPLVATGPSGQQDPPLLQRER